MVLTIILWELALLRLVHYTGLYNLKNNVMSFCSCSEEPFAGNVEAVRMGEDVLATIASSGSLYAFKSTSFWSSIKNAG